jgi:hypothetical protein
MPALPTWTHGIQVVRKTAQLPFLGFGEFHRSAL